MEISFGFNEKYVIVYYFKFGISSMVTVTNFLGKLLVISCENYSQRLSV